MKSRQSRSIEIFAKDDAKWDKCFAAVNKAGVIRNPTITCYNPPQDPDEKQIYDNAWKKAKGAE
jgi:hypothetical protein